ncbi:transposase [Streptomyces sp. NPDC046275]|uniref:transposase n=1 Tax=Streptomyces sp. NPDC046275 TaxID=3157201 RepID=UPI0033DBBC57
MTCYQLHLAAVTSAVRQRAAAAGGPQGLRSGPAAAHLAAVRAHDSLGARRVWTLLPRISRSYLAHVPLPEWAVRAVADETPRPGTSSVLRESVTRGMWAGPPPTDERWVKATTSLCQTGVPVWRGDAVVLGGTWSDAQVADAVQLVTLRALAGAQPPALVVPVVLGGSGPGRTPDVPGPLSRLVLAALYEEAARTGGVVVVTTDTTLITTDETGRLHRGLRPVPRLAPPADPIADVQWHVLSSALPQTVTPPKRGPRPDPRRHLASTLWRLRTGRPWTEIPARAGSPARAFVWWQTYQEDGTLDRLRALLGTGPGEPPSAPANRLTAARA